ncbi:MAG: HEAT repeat domain-containing protein [Pirellulales bacterium]|nr:HEAT repeat domain-containing protein [Pirellulales bacterium]
MRNNTTPSLRPGMAVMLIVATTIVPRTFAAEPRGPAELIKLATSGPAEERYTAIDDLGELHADAVLVVPELSKLLSDTDVQVRWRSARSLGEYGEQAKSSGAAILKLLKDKDPIVQYHAVVALGKLGDRSEPIVGALVDAATNADARVARAAVAAIRRLKPGPKRVAEVLSKAIRSKDQAVTLHALEVIVEHGTEAVPFLKEALTHPETAYLACAAIEQIGPDAAGTVPELTAILGKTKHSHMLIQTLLALASIGPAAESAAPQISELLEHSSDETVPVAAAYALGSIGGQASLDPLKAAARKSDPFLQMIATWALAKAQPGDAVARQRAIEKLVQGLRSDREEIRTAAAKCLQSLAAPPEVIAPHFVALMNDSNPDVQANAVEAIASLGESVVPRVNLGLKMPRLRLAAVRVIAKLGPKASGSVKPLMEAAQGADAKLLTEIQLALGAIGPAAAPATELLVKSLSSKDAGERESALFALRKIGRPAQAAVKPLLEKMAADDSFDANAAAWALARIASEDKAVMEAVVVKLTKCLSNREEQTRLESISALADLGAAAKSARTALQQVADKDSSPIVRAAAQAALEP